MFILFTTPDYEKDFKETIVKTIEMNRIPSKEKIVYNVRGPGDIIDTFTIEMLSNLVDLVGMNELDAKYVRDLNIELCAALALRNPFNWLLTHNSMETKDFFHGTYYVTDNVIPLGKSRSYEGKEPSGEHGTSYKDIRDNPECINSRMNGLLIENLNYERTCPDNESSKLPLSFKCIFDLKSAGSKADKTTMEKFLFSWDENRNYHYFVYTLGNDIIQYLDPKGYTSSWRTDLSRGNYRTIRDMLVDIAMEDKSLSIRDIGGHELFDSRVLRV